MLFWIQVIGTEEQKMVSVSVLTLQVLAASRSWELFHTSQGGGSAVSSGWDLAHVLKHAQAGPSCAATRLLLLTEEPHLLCGTMHGPWPPPSHCPCCHTHAGLGFKVAGRSEVSCVPMAVTPHGSARCLCSAYSVSPAKRRMI